MNRQAFKLRMQNLKSYRDSNPGKGYWDWKLGTEEGRIDFMERLARSKAKEWNVNEDEILLEMLNDNTYNYKQMYYDNPNYDIKKGHFSDTYKTVYHPTFSEESMYSGNKSLYNPDGITGGSWDYNNKVFRANPKLDTKETQLYLDREDPGWKVLTYADGGEVDSNTGQPSLDYIKLREWLNNWLPKRTKQMVNNIDHYTSLNYYGSDFSRAEARPWFFLNKEKNAKRVINELLQAANTTPVYDYREPWIINNYENIPSSKTFLKLKAGVQAAFIPGDNTISISPIAHDDSSILHELTHTTLNKYDILESVVNDILEKNNQKNDRYYDNPNEVYSRMMLFRYDNKIKPLDTITKEQIEKWKNDDSIIDNDFIGRYSTNTIEDLLNTVALNSAKKLRKYADGGTTGDPEKELFFQATGRSRSGRPLELGLRPVFDLEDAAGMTPIGDVMSARDTYNAVRLKDWLGAGLAAVGVLPFVPMTVRLFRKKYKGTTPKFNTTVNKNATANAIDAFDVERARRQAIIDSSTELIPKANNQGYKVALRLMEDPDYISRAAEVLKKFGDDYLTTYADILLAYNEDPSKLLKADFKFYPDKSLGRAAVEVSEEAVKRHKAGGEFAKMGEYNYRIDPSRTDLSGNVTEHEWNHYVDFLKNKSPGADGNSNMFYLMGKDLDGIKIDSNDLYFAKPTELKAYMNLFREYLFNSGKINKRGDKVSPSLLKKELEKLSTVPEYSSVIRASKLFGSNAKYTKWFNTIPLLGVGAIGANQYFTKEKKKQQ